MMSSLSPRMPVLLSLLGLGACSALPQGADSAAPPVAPGALAGDALDTGAPAAPDAIGPTLRADRRQFAAAPGSAFETHRRGLHARFDETGLVAWSGDGELGLRFVGFGREDAVQPLVDVLPRQGGCAVGAERVGRECVRQVERDFGGVTEWWVARESGLQQGWTLQAPPEGAGLLELQVEVDGAVAWVEEDRARLTDGAGGTWTYGDLLAWDADGRDLPVELAAGSGGLRLRVDDTGARWPITVDPILASVTETKLTASDADGGDRFGDALAGVGDVNGDGYDDIVVGARGEEDIEPSSGAAYVYLGSASGIDSSTEVRLKEPVPTNSAEYGSAVAGAGDVDGDGYDDVLIGSYQGTGASTYTGAVYLYYGSATGISASAVDKITASDGARTDAFGIAVAGAGDIDGDGYDDVVIGAYGDSDTARYSGSAYVYYGTATGISASSEDKLNASDATSYALFGYAVSGAGDIDGDGHDDVIVGAPYASSSAGKAYVYYGSSTGISLSSEDKVVASDAAASDSFGLSLSGGGDLDGDGYDDVVIGAYGDDDAGSNSGSAYVYYGTASGLDTSAADKLNAGTSASGIEFGGSVSLAGDIDADGYDDVVIGARKASGSYTQNGLAYVFYGSSTGIVSGSSDTLEASDAADYDYFGGAISGAGDVNGDGYDNVLVGAYHNDDAGSASGAAYVFAQGCVSATYYADTDLDGYGDSASSVEACTAPSGYVTDGSDCDDTDATVNPGATEGVGDSVDQDCDGGEICYADADDDGYTDGASTVTSSDTDCTDAGEGLASDPTGECNDSDATVNPGATELAGDELDQDCDSTELCYADADDDGYTDGASTVTSSDTDCTDAGEGLASDPTGECDDSDAAVNPGATELAGDEVDQDCDGTELCYADDDDDCYTDGASTVTSSDADCTDAGEGLASDPTGECNDTDATVNPGATELAGDEVDQDCDGTELCYADADDDGYTDGASTVTSSDTDCTDAGEGLASDPTGDCGDSDAAVNPGATELAGDNVDQDCDGTELCYADADDDGYTDGASTVTSSDTDCTDAGEGLASDPTGECDDSDATINPGATELAGDEVDQDCDSTELCYADADDDGYTDGASTVTSSDTDCTDAGEGLASDPTGECNDSDATVNPAATELAGDEVDQDCDGTELCYTDVDDDGYTDGTTTITSTDLDCGDTGEALASAPTGDCDDLNPDAYPGAEEVVGDEVDQDCDGGELCFSGRGRRRLHRQ